MPDWGQYKNLTAEQHARLERMIQDAYERQLAKYDRIERDFGVIVGSALDDITLKGWTTERDGKVFLDIADHAADIRARLGTAQAEALALQDEARDALLANLAGARPVNPFISNGVQRPASMREVWKRAVDDYREQAKFDPSIQRTRKEIRETMPTIDVATEGMASNILARVDNDVRQSVLEPLGMLPADGHTPLPQILAWARNLEAFDQNAVALSETAHLRAMARQTTLQLGTEGGVKYWRLGIAPERIANVRPNGILQRVLYDIRTMDGWIDRVGELAKAGVVTEDGVRNFSSLGLHHNDFSWIEPVPPALEKEALEDVEAERAALAEALRKRQRQLRGETDDAGDDEED